jgi:glutamate N-acetyltransferase/amino-acid N-acetyltransferase
MATLINEAAAELCAVTGFDAAGVAAGIKKSGALDLTLVASLVPCRAAGIFTRNAFPAAPVTYDRRVLDFNPQGIRGVLINSGCANACTGIEGDVNARRSAEAVEMALGASDSSVLVMSTGVIGPQLPMEALLGGVAPVVDALTPEGWPDAARAIMTTDTRPKLATVTVELPAGDGSVTVRLTGIAKGAGMIHPDMATMLALVVTDAAIAQPLLAQALRSAADRSFNRISVDGDTSTNDTLLLLANGLADNDEIDAQEQPGYGAFLDALTDLCTLLAQAIVRDGEGATRFVTIRVEGASSDADAHRVANTIATSPLVKTALFGGDANWGRILAAVGRAGVPVDPARASLTINGGAVAGGTADGGTAEGGAPDGGAPDGGARLGALLVVEAGRPVAYSEEQATALFAQPEIDVLVELGLGEGAATVWTSDLSYDYVRINGDYRT